MKKRVLLGMSGGVDSSVSAILLQEQGYEVIGATMVLWEEKSNSDCSFSAVEDAKQVCDFLGIEHHIMDAKETFCKRVIHNFIECYENAKTPNPCVECNQYLKFGLFFEKAKELNCDYIATGHYAKKEYSETYQRNVIKKAEAEKKDQSYFLYRISQEALDSILFPLADYTDKSEIREIAEKRGLQIAQKPDSQEICFIPDGDYIGYLKAHSKAQEKKGEIVLKNGTILGKHKGIMHYTVGQRKGLGIAYASPLYVIGIDQEKNQIMVGTEEELYQKTLTAIDIHFLAIDELKENMPVKAKIRYRAKEADAKIEVREAGKIVVIFEEPQRAITPGQSVVFYDQNEVVIGGGKIA